MFEEILTVVVRKIVLKFFQKVTTLSGVIVHVRPSRFFNFKPTIDSSPPFFWTRKKLNAKNEKQNWLFTCFTFLNSLFFRLKKKVQVAGRCVTMSWWTWFSTTREELIFLKNEKIILKKKNVLKNDVFDFLKNIFVVFKKKLAFRSAFLEQALISLNSEFLRDFTNHFLILFCFLIFLFKIWRIVFFSVSKSV